jgi:hypothetical protein
MRREIQNFYDAYKEIPLAKKAGPTSVRSNSSLGLPWGEEPRFSL